MLVHRSPKWCVVSLFRIGTEPRKTFFTMFVDWIFTSFVERPFTNVFDAAAPMNAAACLYRACNAD
jgi:hypothetical protein